MTMKGKMIVIDAQCGGGKIYCMNNLIKTLANCKKDEQYVLSITNCTGLAAYRANKLDLKFYKTIPLAGEWNGYRSVTGRSGTVYSLVK